MVAILQYKPNSERTDELELHAVAIALSGTGSRALGRLFGRFGLRALIVLTLISTLFAPMAFHGELDRTARGCSAGLGIDVHESIVPATVASMIQPSRRACAFGILHPYAARGSSAAPRLASCTIFRGL